jgi:glycosyltransferase involved in cell wall biosynthesis
LIEKNQLLHKPLVSFVIPVLNGEKDIGRCLASIRNLECAVEEYEIIVVDNGSTDRSRQIIEESGVEAYVFPKLRVGALRNRGAALARGDYIAFVDSDVAVASHWLVAGLAAFEEAGVVATGCFPNIPVPATWVQRMWDIHQREKAEAVRQRIVSWLPSMNLIVHRESFIAIGGFNEALESAEDVDLCYRLTDKGLIVKNPFMKAVHWGEAKNLQGFWRKELWRGQGNIKGFLSHKFRWEELPSLGYPIYMIGIFVILITSLVLDFQEKALVWSPFALSLWILPACFLAASTVNVTKRFHAFPQLAVIYFVYGIARACAVVTFYRKK